MVCVPHRIWAVADPGLFSLYFVVSTNSTKNVLMTIGDCCIRTWSLR